MTVRAFVDWADALRAEAKPDLTTLAARAEISRFATNLEAFSGIRSYAGNIAAFSQNYGRLLLDNYDGEFTPDRSRIYSRDELTTPHLIQLTVDDVIAWTGTTTQFIGSRSDQWLAEVELRSALNEHLLDTPITDIMAFDPYPALLYLRRPLTGGANTFTNLHDLFRIISGVINRNGDVLSNPAEYKFNSVGHILYKIIDNARGTLTLRELMEQYAALHSCFGYEDEWGRWNMAPLSATETATPEADLNANDVVIEDIPTDEHTDSIVNELYWRNATSTFRTLLDQYFICVNIAGIVTPLVPGTHLETHYREPMNTYALLGDEPFTGAFELCEAMGIFLGAYQPAFDPDDQIEYYSLEGVNQDATYTLSGGIPRIGSVIERYEMIAHKTFLYGSSENPPSGGITQEWLHWARGIIANPDRAGRSAESLAVIEAVYEINRTDPISPADPFITHMVGNFWRTDPPVSDPIALDRFFGVAIIRRRDVDNVADSRLRFNRWQQREWTSATRAQYGRRQFISRLASDSFDFDLSNAPATFREAASHAEATVPLQVGNDVDLLRVGNRAAVSATRHNGDYVRDVGRIIHQSITLERSNPAVPRITSRIALSIDHRAGLNYLVWRGQRVSWRDGRLYIPTPTP